MSVNVGIACNGVCVEMIVCQLYMKSYFQQQMSNTNVLRCYKSFILMRLTGRNDCCRKWGIQPMLKVRYCESFYDDICQG